MSSQYQKYYKIDAYTHEEEEDLISKGKNVRNYGRLNREIIEELVTLDLEDDGKREDLINNRERPWRMRRFLTDLMFDKLHISEGLEIGFVERYGGANSSCKYGVVNYQGYTLRVVDGGIDEALGRTTSTDEENNFEDSQVQVTALRNTMRTGLRIYSSQADFSPWDTNNFENYWDGFELWRELMSSVLINALPDRPFTMFVFSKDAVGDDVPIYYMELEINGDIDRHTVIWEMDQVLTTRRKGARPHEAEAMSEYVSAYQRVYFYINWDLEEKRRVTRLVISDLAKSQYYGWKRWLQDMHTTSWFDAVSAIFIIIVSAYLSILVKDAGIALVGGIIVSGVAAEEWIPPQTVVMGAIARFYAHESLALRVYYRTSNGLTIRRVVITLFATLPEAAQVIGASIFFGDAGANDGVVWLGLTASEVVLVIAASINVFCLFQTTYSGVFSRFSHSDFPRRSYTLAPRCYVTNYTSSYLRQIIEDCRPLEEFCSVFRPLIHWQKEVDHVFLGDDIDLGAPGSPPSMACYWFSFPASAVVQTQAVYGSYYWWLVPVAAVEQFIAFLGGLLVIILDIPVVFALFGISFLKYTGCFDRAFIRYLTGTALMIYLPCDLILIFLYGFFHAPLSLILGVEGLSCRTRSTARLYRLPLIKSVRTGRTSNHSWKFGDYIYDQAYHRCSDMVIVNPRAAKLGMMEANRHFFKRHKLIWTQKDGVRYETPILSCGDNSISRRSSIIPQSVPGGPLGSIFGGTGRRNQSAVPRHGMILPMDEAEALAEEYDE